MKKLSVTLSRKHLLTIYKSFVSPNLDYADIIYDKRLNEFVYELSGCGFFLNPSLKIYSEVRLLNGLLYGAEISLQG